MGGIWDVNTVNNARKCERICDEKFKIMTGATNWFVTVSKNPENSIIDYTGTTKNNLTVDIELKKRYIYYNQYDSIFIEPEKFIVLSGSTKDKGLYVNFLNNDIIQIIDIKQLKETDYQLIENVSVKTDGLDEKYRYNTSRYIIYNNVCHFFKFDKTNNKITKINYTNE